MRQDKYERKKKRISIIMTIGIAVIMVASIFAIVVDNQSSGVPKYNKQSFTLTDTGYKTKINGTYFEFYNHPSELERIALDSKVIPELRNSAGILIVFNPNENSSDILQFIDLARYDMQSQFGKPTYFGITKESDKYTMPVLSCANATIDYPLIIINSSTSTDVQVSPENSNCIIINAKLRELLAAKDRIIYSYYGIMN